MTTTIPVADIVVVLLLWTFVAVLFLWNSVIRPVLEDYRKNASRGRCIVATLVLFGLVYVGGSLDKRSPGSDSFGDADSMGVPFQNSSLCDSLRANQETDSGLAITNLCFCEISLTPTSVWLSAAWPDTEILPNRTLDLYYKDELANPSWEVLCSQHVGTGTSNVVFEVLGEDFDEFPGTRGFFKLGTRMDTDGDGLYDAYEHLVLHTSALLSDTDGDGLYDGEEIQAGTDPLHLDSDGDGYCDGEEILAGTNPLVANATPGATIRYFYDEDDRLTDCFIGISLSASSQLLTASGNMEATTER